MACRRAQRRGTGQNEVGRAARGGTRSAQRGVEPGGRRHNGEATTEGPAALAPTARACTHHRTKPERSRTGGARPPRNPGDGEGKAASRGRADGRTDSGGVGV